MQRKHRLAWRLSAIVLIIVAVTTLGVGWLSNQLSRQFALDAALEIMRTDAYSVRNGLDDLMTKQHCREAVDLIDVMSSHGTISKDVSLIAHPSGRIATTRRHAPSTVLDRNERSCLLCHVTDDPPEAAGDVLHAVFTGADGERRVHAVTPIANRPDCRTAACHRHDESGPVVGFLITEYSLAGFDDRGSRLNPLLAATAVLAILLSFGAMVLMFRWQIAKPLRRLAAGIGTLARGDLNYRFPAERDDEIGLAEEQFNELADQIGAHRRELQKVRDYIDGVVEHSGDIIITVNSGGLIQTFNHGAELALGYGRMEVVGKPVEMLFVDPGEREAALAELANEDSVRNREVRFKTKDGQVRHVLLTLSLLTNRRGEHIGTVGISKDVTNEKELQQKLMRSEQEAAIGHAVTAIQHAIKNMLNTMRGGLYVARVGQKNENPQQITEGYEMVEEGLARIGDLSHGMLRYAREWKIEPEPVDLVDMLEKIALSSRQTADEREVKITTELDRSLTEVSCDPRLIHMCLMDLVSNALDACDMKDYPEGEDPTLCLRVTRDADNRQTIVEIQDNGIGMLQEVIDNVFTPFFSTKKKMGTGLGLALTARIIDLHNGGIVVESEPEMGATFRITLPL